VQPRVEGVEDKIIKGSRRPDGSFRKDIRVRAGYVPQDEVKLYVSKGKQWAQDAPKCPGFYEEEEDLRKGKSKSALKNEKRKQKKQQERSEGLDASPATVVDAATERISQMKITEHEVPTEEAPQVVLERKIRNLRKKVRQCEALEEKIQQGGELNSSEKEKLSKVAGWRKEVADMETELAQLGGQQ